MPWPGTELLRLNREVPLGKEAMFTLSTKAICPAAEVK